MAPVHGNSGTMGKGAVLDVGMGIPERGEDTTVTRQARWGVVSQILLSWLLTLPIAAVIAGACHLILMR
jgi:phosphate/sulfate permease